MSVHIVEVTS